jgi:hypothetical protein
LVDDPLKSSQQQQQLVNSLLLHAPVGWWTDEEFVTILQARFVERTSASCTKTIVYDDWLMKRCALERGLESTIKEF